MITVVGPWGSVGPLLLDNKPGDDFENNDGDPVDTFILDEGYVDVGSPTSIAMQIQEGDRKSGIDGWQVEWVSVERLDGSTGQAINTVTFPAKKDEWLDDSRGERNITLTPLANPGE